MIVEIVIKMVLNVVVDLDAAIVSKIVDLILVVVPFRSVDGVSRVPAIPKVLGIGPVLVSIRFEVVYFGLILGTPLIPVILGIFDRLIPLRRTIFGPIGELILVNEPVTGALIKSPREVTTGGATLDLVRQVATALTRELTAALAFVAAASSRRAVPPASEDNDEPDPLGCDWIFDATSDRLILLPPAVLLGSLPPAFWEAGREIFLEPPPPLRWYPPPANEPLPRFTLPPPRPPPPIPPARLM
jgi:hypothetical protein